MAACTENTLPAIMARLLIHGMRIRIVIIPGMGRLMIGTITGTEVITGSDTGTGTGIEIGTEAAPSGRGQTL